MTSIDFIRLPVAVRSHHSSHILQEADSLFRQKDDLGKSLVNLYLNNTPFQRGTIRLKNPKFLPF